jgi:tyrosinase
VGTRKNAATLSATELTNLRDAFTAVYALRDERGYGWHAGVHGLPLPEFCEHGTPLFFPWHRAYLYFFERALTDALRRVRGDRTVSVSLPWWDWTSAASHATGIPPGYQPAPGNPLAAGPVTLNAAELERVRRVPGKISDGPSPVTLRDSEEPDELPRAATIRRVLRAASFREFSAVIESIHGGVHVWVGGGMTDVDVAAYDPIFWAHHAMIDRLWYLWQLSPQGRNPSADLLDTPLAPWRITVRQTLDISRLGYEYAAQVIG